MAKRILAVVVSLVLVFGCILSCTVSSHAFGDYDGDYDYGDWDNDWGNDWDDDDDNYGYGYGYSGYSDGDGYGGSSGSIAGTGVLFALFLIIFITSILYMSKRRKQSKGRSSQQNRSVPRGNPVLNEGFRRGILIEEETDLKPIEEYTAIDPSFSPSAFKEKIANLFVQFQQGWQNKDLEPLRPYMSDGYYAQMDNQLDMYRRNHRTKYIERIAVLDVKISGWKQEAGNDVIIVRIKSRFTTYTVDDNTNKILNGSKTAEKFMDYEWLLIRSTGHITASSKGVKVQNCPNCGATVNINHTAKCEYCGSIITVNDYDWVVNGIKGIAQHTVG